ncbi:hypothetical protein [Peribacillus sp. SCS-155]|uniref:hypothetical protein n=1 Tax=Peribacillus sedimenti TaxID=3115297 RepID=UPI0039066B40
MREVATMRRERRRQLHMEKNGHKKHYHWFNFVADVLWAAGDLIISGIVHLIRLLLRMLHHAN